MFAHRLALELGTWDVDALLEEIPWPIFKRWMAYFRAEPWGTDLHRNLTSLLCAAFSNAMGGKKNGTPFQPSDFPIEFGPDSDDDSSDALPDHEQMMSMMEALGASFKKVG